MMQYLELFSSPSKLHELYGFSYVSLKLTTPFSPFDYLTFFEKRLKLQKRRLKTTKRFFFRLFSCFTANIRLLISNKKKLA